MAHGTWHMDMDMDMAHGTWTWTWTWAPFPTTTYFWSLCPLPFCNGMPQVERLPATDGPRAQAGRSPSFSDGSCCSGSIPATEAPKATG
eukprot:3954266-Prymnesium_polylepis.1